MCGIVGQFSFSGRMVDLESTKQIFRRLIALMARRGPDDEGLWTDDERCILGFRRLAILDLSDAARQPMCTEEGRYVILYNGEVYNFRELRHELAQKGITFRSTGDTEVVLHALAYWGPEALARFNGMFALALYDAFEKRILLARDHAGMKPLYYLLSPQGLLFSSQYDQILAHPWSHDLGISQDGLGLYLRLGYIPAPYALIKNTHMLEPGMWLSFDSDGRVQSGRSFQFPIHRKPDLFGQEAYDAVDAAVDSAVRRHLVSDVPLGAFLSGGIDSPLIVAKAQASKSGDFMAFTVGTAGDKSDESLDAVAYAHELGVKHTVEHLTPDRAATMLNEVVSACGEPFADYSIFPTMFACKLASRQVKVMLSGDGGDELFFGYTGRLGSLLALLQVNVSPQREQSKRDQLDLKKVMSFGVAQSDARWPSSIGHLYRMTHTHLGEFLLQKIFPELPKWPENDSLFRHSDWDRDRTAQWVRWNEFTSFLTQVLLKVDRASMYSSVEVRVPLLDKEVIDVALSVDWRSCFDFQRRIGKLPLRHSLARHVQRQTASKRGFSVPIDSWFRGHLRSLFEEQIMERREILGLAINQKALHPWFIRHVSGEVDQGSGLWLLLSLALWEKHHCQGRNLKFT